MAIYQIVENYDIEKHAGSKATNDVIDILSSMNIKKVPVLIATRNQGLFSKVWRQLKFFKDWLNVYAHIPNGSILILQNPFRIRQLGRYQILMRLKKEKNVKIISIIHDVELLRYDTKFSRKEFQETLVIADQLIVHNDSMKQWFIEQGVSEFKLISLEIFDYLSDKLSDVPTNYSKKVVIAGNLAKEKSPYVYKLGQISNVNFELLGVNYEPQKNDSNVVYHGAFAPDDVPNHLTHGFGLVWDGSEIDSCAGETGNYLRYNNPHKLSLYLSSSLPVIIWSEAAEAKFVEKHQVGLTISSLYELEGKLAQLTEDNYQIMVKNTKRIKEQLQNGYYLKNAISKALERI